MTDLYLRDRWSKMQFLHTADQSCKSQESWIAGALDPKGAISVDQAQTALRQGKLYPPAQK